MPTPTTSPTANDETVLTVSEMQYLHREDASVRVWDYAYKNGQSLDTDSVFATIYSSAQIVLSSISSHAVVLRALSLIFFGCCTNVYTLESILTLSPATGTLITATQFLLIALYKLPSQLTFTTVSPPEPPPLRSTQTHLLPRLKPRKIPISAWVQYALQFVAINTLNNAAFGYKISLPLHIILRSAGPVASMLVGWAWTSRRYSRQKIAAVGLLSLGVVIAALFDSAGAGKSQPSNTQDDTSTANYTKSTVDERNQVEVTVAPTQTMGFVLLSLALVLSATMGVWCDGLYAKYGREAAIADEQLFYSHILALPFFLAQWTALKAQYLSLAYSTASSHSSSRGVLAKAIDSLHTRSSTVYRDLPQFVPLLLGNGATQIACISGVHRLSTQTSALTVSIVLNIRKLVSLLLSIWLFGNKLTLGVMIGAVLVFAGGGLYSMPERRPSVKSSSAGDPPGSANSANKKKQQ